MNPFVKLIKREFWGRAILSVILVGSFFAVLVGIEHAMLGDHKLDAAYKEILMLLLGALIASFSKVIDFWFKDNGFDKSLFDKIQPESLTSSDDKHKDAPVPSTTSQDPNACQCEDCK